MRRGLLLKAALTFTLALTALAIEGRDAHAATAASGCGVCTNADCFTAAIGCVMICGGQLISCDYDGSCLGTNGTWYPITANFGADI